MKENYQKSVHLFSPKMFIGGGNYSPPKKSIGSVGTTVLLDTSIACQAFFE